MARARKDREAAAEHSLAAVLDTEAAGALRTECLDRLGAGQPILLGGASVGRVGQASLQVMAAARIAASQAGLAYAVNQPSDALREMAALAGLSVVLEPNG